jgi:hypothetical protein
MNMSSQDEVIRPFNPDAIRRLRGKYKDLPGPSSDEMRDAERQEEARREWLSMNRLP